MPSELPSMPADLVFLLLVPGARAGERKGIECLSVLGSSTALNPPPMARAIPAQIQPGRSQGSCHSLGDLQRTAWMANRPDSPEAIYELAAVDRRARLEALGGP